MVLSSSIFNYIQSKKGACEVFPSPFAVFLNANNEIYVEPDIAVICDKDKLTEKGCNGAPDWVIEIVSPSSRTLDYSKKLFKYRTAGVREYWIVDYEKNLIMAYDFEHEGMTDSTFSDKVKSWVFEDLEIDFSGIDLE